MNRPLPEVIEEERREIIQGKKIVSPSASIYHQNVAGNFFRLLDQFLQGEQLGKVFLAPLDVHFGENTILQPDVFYLPNEKINLKEKWVYEVPDLIAEVVSPTSIHRDTVDKFRLYQEFGVQEYWLIFPLEETITVYRLINGRFELHSMAVESASVAKSNYFEGFEVRLESLFKK